MADTSRSSFIPRQTSGAIPSTVRRRRKFHVFGFIATFLLLTSLALAIGTYFYKGYTESELESEKLALASERDRFNEGDILSVQEFERRLDAANYLLNNHVSPSKIFDTLELKTQDRIQFLSFLFEQRPSQDVTLTVTGGTEEFKTVALQAVQFGDDPLLKDVEFTDLGTNETNESQTLGNNPELTAEQHRISFSVTGDISSALLMYEGTESTLPAASSEEPAQPEGDTADEDTPASEDDTASQGGADDDTAATGTPDTINN